MDLETTSEQRLRFLLDLARALLNSIFDFSSDVRVEADNKDASFDDADGGERGGEESILRRFAAGCLNKSIRVLEEEDEPFISAFSELFPENLADQFIPWRELLTFCPFLALHVPILFYFFIFPEQSLKS